MNKLHIDKTHWKKYRFGDVAIQTKEVVDIENTSLTRYVAGEHMFSEDIHLRKWGTIGDGYLGPAFIRKFNKGDILYGSRRTYLKKVAIADFDGITANTTFVIKANEDLIEPVLLAHLMLSHDFTEYSVKNSRGSVNPYINWKDIADYEFLLPPKAEQKRLAELLWAADEVVEKEKRELEKITVCKNNYFEREIIDAKKLRLIDCCKELPQYGSPSAAIPYIKEKSRYVRITDIDDFGNLINDDIVSPSVFSDTFLLKENDFLIARTGNTVGKTYLHQIKDGLYTFAGYLIRFRTDDSILLPDYLMAFSKTSLFEEFKRKTIKVGAQPNINAEQYSNMEIPVLPIERQRKIKQNIDNYDSAYKRVLSQIALSQQIKQELINKVF